MTTPRDPIYTGHRYPAKISSYAVWLYFRFPLSLRMIEEMLAARGISVTHETIRQWGLKFGQVFANRIRQRAPRRGDKWHLDEVVITIAGNKHWLWRAVGQDRLVLDILVQSWRDKKAAKRLFRKLLGMQSEREWARAVVRDIARRYLASRRECVDAFVNRHFSLTGTLRLHRRAIGWDLLRVPANLLLSPATLAVSVASRIAARLGLARTAAWLDRHRPFSDTAVAREVSWLVTTELLQLPCAQPRRTYTEDALAACRTGV